MAKSDYLCCSVCDNKIVYADTDPGYANEDESPISAMCASCVGKTKGIVRDCQAILTRGLTDDLSDHDVVSELLGILDGPRTREIFPNEPHSPTPATTAEDQS